MIRIKIPDMDLAQICGSGQVFRMWRTDSGRYALIAGGDYLEVEQAGTEFTFFCTEDEFRERWYSYFDLAADYGAVKRKIDRNDGYLKRAAEFGHGIRILRQDLWETLVSFLISQQNNIPRIKNSVEMLCARYGEKRYRFGSEAYYAFPVAGALAFAEEEELRECGVGYRSRYLKSCAEAVAGGAPDLEGFQALSYEEAGQELQKLYGVGVKVAECVCLYALHHVDAFPIDTHIGKILERYYPEGFPLERYPGCAGILQQYMFYYDLNGEGAGKGSRSKAGRPLSARSRAGSDTELPGARNGNIRQ